MSTTQGKEMSYLICGQPILDVIYHGNKYNYK